MIFRNTFRLLVSNFSNVWKVLLYYVICILLSLAVCTVIALPIIDKLNQANVFNDFFAILDNIFFAKPDATAISIEQVNENFWSVLNSNPQLNVNIVFLAIYILFVFPFLINLALLPMNEVVYGYMTSQSKYSFTVKFVKYLGKSALYSLVRFFVLLPVNAIILLLIYLMIRLVSLGSFLYFLLAICVLGVLLVFVALKYSFFSCWLPAVTVYNENPLVSIKTNFKSIFKKFGSIFSTSTLLVLLAFVVNFIFCVFSFTLSLLVTLPLTAFTFSIFGLVSFFSCHGMRFYVYPDYVVIPKTFEERDEINKIKYII